MAKSKSFFGLRTGSTKTLTFQVLNGKQITKDRVEIVKNPRTQSQMAQRCLMATASAAYTAMRKIVNHSFQGYSYGQQNMSKFISENVFLLRNAVEIEATDYGYNPFRDRSFKPGAYMISKGTLTPTVYTIETVANNGQMNVILLDGQITGLDSANDIATLLGLSIGEITTICFIYGNNDDGWKFGFMRIKFIKAGSESLNNFQGFFEHFEVTSSLEIKTGYSISTNLSFGLEDADIKTSDEVYFGAIYSRKSANGWLRSTSYITVPDGTELQPDYETALATYPQGAGYILNGAVIPNGGRVEPEPTPSEPEPENLNTICAIQIGDNYFLGARNANDVPFLLYFENSQGDICYICGQYNNGVVDFYINNTPDVLPEECSSSDYQLLYSRSVFMDLYTNNLDYGYKVALTEELTCELDEGEANPHGIIKYRSSLFAQYNDESVTASDIVQL